MSHLPVIISLQSEVVLPISMKIGLQVDIIEHHKQNFCSTNIYIANYETKHLLFDYNISNKHSLEHKTNACSMTAEIATPIT